MKITNTCSSTVTIGAGDDAVSIPPGESAEVKVEKNDPWLAAHLNAENVTVSGRGAPRSEEPAATA